MTLVRFDAVYVVYFKTNVGTIEMNYPNLLEYCKDIYQFPGMAKARLQIEDFFLEDYHRGEW